MVSFGDCASKSDLVCRGEFQISQLLPSRCRSREDKGSAADFQMPHANFGGGRKVLRDFVRQKPFLNRPSQLMNTRWRKTPTHQGGFLLDGGVHFTAGLRLMLGKDNPLATVSAFSAQLQEHLPPVDTVEATGRTKNGAVGTISISFGTTAKGSEWTVGCEDGAVSISRDQVTVDGKTERIEDEKSGVPPEVRNWGKALAAGTTNEQQSPEEALADLELIEAMLRSGEQGGVPIKLEHQEL
ncbi:hypothetical protein HRR80_007221 [Exophiala dermatitidis]|uniref:Gfo/Idh/MocA-like oxidoreductase C-terminal domain-containing protein n=1 Tax=Exophiala dermatitidis TaxID=5970 RepID=A0AAN6ENU4_EXODE|nr:hypothetical protein HRR80_007221 [Exophiala dermatitidis]